MIVVVLVIVIAILLAVVILQRTKLVIAKRDQHIQGTDTVKERKATADILNLCQEVIASNIETDEFLERYIKYVMRAMKGTGGAILYKRQDNSYWGWAVAGSVPSLKKTSPQISQQLMGHPEKHTEFLKKQKFHFTDTDIWAICGQNGYAFFKNDKPFWLPDHFSKDAPRILIAPLEDNEVIKGVVIVTSTNDFDAYQISEKDGAFFKRLTDLAALGLKIIRVFLERQEYEKKIQNAREEGMLQVSSGIIHNIGNAVTTARLAYLELQERLIKDKDSCPEVMMKDELLTVLENHLKEGSLIDFLTSDEVGKQYLSVMKELMTHLYEKRTESIEFLAALAEKMDYISEIVELQQRFVGGLGTENFVDLKELIFSAERFFTGTYISSGLAIKTDVERETPKLLLDPSMITQVLVNVMKYIFDKLEAYDLQQAELLVSLDTEADDEQEGRCFICVEFKLVVFELAENNDNEEPLVFNLNEDSSMSRNKKEMNYDIEFCMTTLKKYNGFLKTEEHDGRPVIKLLIPVES